MSAASPDILTQLRRSQAMLRSVFIGHGSKGGSCGLCRCTWDGDQERHERHCLIHDNASALASAHLFATAPELFAFVAVEAKTDPVFVKGYQKERIALARALVAKATGADT